MDGSLARIPMIRQKDEDQQAPVAAAMTVLGHQTLD
jgi:hypothetical protein